MIKESYQSRELHVTKDGTTLQQYFTINSQDFYLWYDQYTRLPVIGDFWAAMPTLICSDINVRWLSQDKATVEALYSTRGEGAISAVPDKVSSMRYRFSIVSTQEQIKSYRNTTDRIQYDWPVTWGAAKGMDIDLAPALYKNAAGIALTIDVYLSKWNFGTVADNIGKINETDFLKQMVQARPNNRKITEFDATGDDTGLWLFNGCNVETVGKGNAQLSYLFLQNSEGWNTTDGVETGHIESFNFFDLPWPDDTNDEVKIGELA